MWVGYELRPDGLLGLDERIRLQDFAEGATQRALPDSREPEQRDEQCYAPVADAAAGSVMRPRAAITRRIRA